MYVFLALVKTAIVALNVRDIMKTNDMVIVGKSTCKECQKVKMLAEEYGIPYAYIDIDVYSDEIDILYKEFHVRIVPTVFTCGKMLGDYKDLAKILNDCDNKKHKINNSPCYCINK